MSKMNGAIKFFANTKKPKYKKPSSPIPPILALLNENYSPNFSNNKNQIKNSESDKE